MEKTMITKAYFILGSRYARYDAALDQIDTGYPKSIADNWRGFVETGFTDGIDAALNWAGDKVFLFKGDHYLRYDIPANRVDTGYPLPIGEFWTGLAEHGFDSGIDAAANWDNGKVYFFKGSQYLRYDIQGDRVDDGFPLPIAGNWPGLAEAGFADGLDAVINWGNGKAYFFRGDDYLRYDIASDTTDQGYPERCILQSVEGRMRPLAVRSARPAGRDGKRERRPALAAASERRGNRPHPVHAGDPGRPRLGRRNRGLRQAQC